MKGPQSSTVRHVLLTLSLHMNQLGEQAFPSQRLLADRTGLSERAVRNALRVAHAGRWVAIYAKRPKGKAWRLYEYAATIPAELEESLPVPPVESQEFKREEPVSARERGFVPMEADAQRGAERRAAPLAYSGTAKSPQAEGAEPDAIRAEPGAHGAEPDDRRCGTTFQKVRNDVPINLPSNPSVNLPLNASHESALARTGAHGKSSTKDRQPDPETTARHIRKAIATFPDYGSADIAKVAGTNVADVERIRRLA